MPSRARIAIVATFFLLGESFVIAFAAFGDGFLGFLDPEETLDHRVLAVFELLVMLKEMGDFLEDVRGDVVHRGEIVVKGIVLADRDDLLVGLAAIDHLEDADGVATDEGHRHHGFAR